MRVDPKIKRDFNLTGEQLELIEMLQKEAEDISVPMALEPEWIKRRLPSKQKMPVWRVLSPIMAAAVACFAVVVVGQQTLWNVTKPGIPSDLPGIVIPVEKPHTDTPSDSSQGSSNMEVMANVSSQQPDVSSLQEEKENASGTDDNRDLVLQEPSFNLGVNEGRDAPSYSGDVVIVPGSSETPSDGNESAFLEYAGIYQKIEELNGKNPAQVKGVARAANFSAIFGNSSSMVSARQTDAGSHTDTAQFDGKYIYAILENLEAGTQSVVINRVDGENYYTAAELFVDFGMKDDSNYLFSDIRLLNCYVNQGRLTVVGSASYGQPGSSDVLTAVATYDISVPERPVLISNSYQDGVLLSSRVSGGFLYLVTRKTVSDPMEANPQTYVPFQMTDGQYRTMEIDDIHVSQYAESSCYIVASSILLKEPASFYDTMAILGDSSELYVNENSIYLADYIYREGNTYTTIVKSGYGKGSFHFVGETALLGRLFDSEAMDEYEGVLRVVTTRGAGHILYTLDQRLHQLGLMKDIASGQNVKTVQFHQEKIYLATAKEPDKVTVIDVSNALEPVESKKRELPNHTMPMEAFGSGQMVNLEIQQGENEGLKLSLYDMLSSIRIIETASVLVAEGDVYSEAIDNRQALLTIPEQGLIGFSYFKYDDVKGESGCYYALCQFNEQGVVKKLEYQYPSKVYNQRGFVKDNVLYVASSSSLVAFNIDNGKMLWEINF